MAADRTPAQVQADLADLAQEVTHLAGLILGMVSKSPTNDVTVKNRAQAISDRANRIVQDNRD